MGLKQRQWAARARQALIEQLGGACAICSSTIDLEFDHIYRRDWTPRELDPVRRISRYRREAKAGLLQVLCASCNNIKGQPREDAPHEALSHPF